MAGGITDLKIYTTDKNLIFFKRYKYKIDIDLQTIPDIEDLEINFRIIHPNKATIPIVPNPNLENSKNLIIWKLIPGEINTLEFTFWSWNKIMIGIILILLIMIISYALRFYRFKIGTELPQLPSN